MTEKVAKDLALAELHKYASGVVGNPFGTRFYADGMGLHLQLVVERIDDDVDDLDLWTLFTEMKWMGWRFVILRCPPGTAEDICRDLSKRKAGDDDH